MIDHVSIQCADVAASVAFYDAVLAPLGFGRVLDFGETVGFGRPPVPQLWIGPRSTGHGFRETHLGFVAPDRATVEAFYQAAEASVRPCCTRRGCGPSTTPSTSGPSSVIPTATTSRRSVAGRSDRNRRLPG